MQIRSLTIKGLKARDATVNPSRLNIALGPVGSGKSTLIDAMNIGALGYVPRLGKGIQETARLMRGDAIEVGITLDDGRVIGRTLRRRGDGLTQIPEASWVPPKAPNRDHAAAIQQLFGATDGEAAENLDPRVLFLCTPNERASRLERLVAAGSIAPEVLSARIRHLTILRLARIEPERLPKDPQAAEDLAKALASTLTGHSAALDRASEAFGMALADLIEFAKSKLSEERQGSVRLRGAHQELESRRASLPQTAGSITALREERDQLVRQEGALAQAIRNALQRSQDIDAARTQLAAQESLRTQARGLLDAAIARLDEASRLEAEAGAIEIPNVEVPPLADVAPDQAEMARAAAIHAEAVAIQVPDVVLPEVAPVPVDAAELARADELRGRAAELSRRAAAVVVPDLVNNTARAQMDVTLCRHRIEDAEGSPWREVERIADEMDSCAPEAARGWTGDLRAIAKKHGGDIDALRTALAAAEETFRAAIVERDANTEARSVAQRQQAQLRGEADLLLDEAQGIEAAAAALADTRTREARAKRDHDHRAAITERETVASRARARFDEAAKIRGAAEDAARAATRQLQAERDAVVQAAVRARDAASARREALLGDARKIRQQAVGAQRAFDAAHAAVTQIEQRIAGLTTGATQENPQDQLTLVRAKRAERDATIASLESAEALRREIQRALDDIAAADAMADVWSAIEWAGRLVRGDDLRARAGGLQDRVRTFLRAAGRPEEPYIRAAKGVCDFGWIRDGHEISVEALSGGEFVTYAAALQAGIVATRGPEIKLLLIEAAELGSSEAAQAVLRGCEAVQEWFDHILVATCADIAAPEGWNVLDMRRAPAEAAV